MKLKKLMIGLFTGFAVTLTAMFGKFHHTHSYAENTVTETDQVTYSGNSIIDALEPMAIYESDNATAGTILGVLNDGAGQNYGPYSLTENYTMPDFLAYLSEKYPEFYARLQSPVNSEEFNANWQQIGAENESKFKQAQAEFIFNKTIVPAITKLKADTGVDLIDGTHSIGAVGMFASLIHNGGYLWYNQIKLAADELNQTHDDNKFIEAIGGHVRDNYSGNYAHGIRNRYTKQVPYEQKRTKLFKNN